MSIILSNKISLNANETLYIIGNGFDIAHDIASSYSDFKEWALQKYGQTFINNMDRFFSIKQSFWSNVEQALGEYNVDQIIKECSPDEGIDINHITTSTAAVEDAPDYFFKPDINKFKQCFKEWVDSIDLNCAYSQKDVYPIDSSSMYFSFNYTETLEKIYNVPSSNIFHIHGSRINHNSYIFGHNNLMDENAPYKDDKKWPHEQDTMNKIIGWMNAFYKNTANIIEKNASFFKNLSNIKNVIVIGSSMGNVDIPYFEEIAKNVDKQCFWYFYCHSKSNEEIFKKCATNLNLKVGDMFLE